MKNELLALLLTLTFLVFSSHVTAITFPDFTPPSYNMSNPFSGMGTIDIGPLNFVASKNLNNWALIYPAKVTVSDREEIVGIPVGIFGTSNSSLQVYNVDGNSISTPAQYPGYQYNRRATSLTLASGFYPGSLRVAGFSSSGANMTPLLASSTYVRGSLSSPSPIALSGLPSSAKRIDSIDSGDVSGDGYADLVLVINEGSYPGRNRLYAKIADGGYDDYSLSENSGQVVIGNFASSQGNEFAYVGRTSSNQTKLYLFKYQSGAIQNLASATVTTAAGSRITANAIEAADINGDGYDEIIIGGKFTSLFGSSSDAVLAYRYTGSAWSRVNEFTTATGSSTGEARDVGAVDFDLDGRKDIVTITTNKSSSGNVYKLEAHLFKHNASGTKFVHFSEDAIGPSSPTPTNYYNYISSAFGDFTGDGQADLALVYVPADFAYTRLMVYKIGGDITPPNVTITSPTISSFNLNTTIYVTASASDLGGIQPSSVKMKLSRTGYDSGFKTAPALSCIGTCEINLYRTNFSLAGLSPGNYTLYVEAKDLAGNKGTKTKAITLVAPPGPLAPVGGDVTPPVVGVYFSKLSYYSNETVNVTVQASDNVGIGNPSSPDNNLVKVRMTGPGGYSTLEYNALETSANSRLFRIYFSIDARPPGVYTVTATATDLAGNVGSDSSNFTILALPEGGAPPASEEEAPAPAEETPAPGEELPIACTLDSSSCGEGTELNLDLCACVAIQPETPEIPPVEQPAPSTQPPAAPGTGTTTPPGGIAPPAGTAPPVSAPENTSTASAQSAQLITELESKIAEVKSQGADTATLDKALAKAKSLQQQKKYVESALEAQKGLNEATNLQPKGLGIDLPGDMTLYAIIGGAILLFLGLLFFGGLIGLGGLAAGIALLLGRKPPAPPPAEPAAKPSKKAGKKKASQED